MVNLSFDIFAIDPLALLLRNDIYVKLKLPDPPPIDVLVQRLAPVLTKLDTHERELLLSRAKLMAANAEAVMRALNTK